MNEQTNSIHQLKITSLGERSVEWNGRLLSEDLSEKSIVLLIYLASHREIQSKRDKIAAYFWDKSDQKSARYNLRYALWSIKKVIQGESVIYSDKFSCYLDPDVSLIFDFNDLEYIHNHREEQEYYAIEEALSSYKGEFLSDVYLNNAAEVNDWILYTRAYLERLYFELTEYVATEYRKSGDPQKAIEKYEKLLSINPYYEGAYYQIMESFLELKMPHKAIEKFSQCRELLRNELYIEPSEDLLNLYAAIQEKKTLDNGASTGIRKNDENINRQYDVISIDLESRIEYFSLQKIVATMMRFIDKSRVNPAIWKEISSLVHVYPPLIHECNNITVYPTEAAITHGVNILMEEYLSKGKKILRIDKLKDADPKTAMILEEVQKHFTLKSTSLIQFTV